MEMENLQINIQSKECMPLRCHKFDAGLDLKNGEKSFILKPFQRKLVSTGVKVNIPEGYVGYVMSRSGLAHKQGIIVLNAPGVIDSGYTNYVKVNLINFGDEEYCVKKFERIAQLVVQKIELCETVVEEFTVHDDNNRGMSGHGSTGT